MVAAIQGSTNWQVDSKSAALHRRTGQGQPAGIRCRLQLSEDASGRAKGRYKFNCSPIAIKQFIKLKSADKAYATIIKYRNILSHFRDMLGDSFPVEDIDNRVIEQFKLYYLNEHSKTDTNMALRHLKVFIYWCYDKGYLAKKPKFEMLKTAKRDVRWLTKGEYFKLFELAPQEVKDVMTLCISTGARIREILERPWKDFNFKDQCNHPGCKHREGPLPVCLIHEQPVH